MTADSYSLTKEQSKDNILENGHKLPDDDISEEKHSLFSCMKLSTLDKICCFLAEFLGTGLLVFLGCMGCIQGDGIPNSHLQIIFNFGMAVMLIIQIFGCVSGSHINPAVTVAAYIYNLVTLPMAFVYFAGQMIGGFVGFGLLKLVVPEEYVIGKEGNSTQLCMTLPSNGTSAFQAFAIEFIITMVLVLVCCGVWDPRNAKHHDSVPLRFGFAISALACAAGPFTGASMNPARSFGPALWHVNFTDHWVYWVGPLAAAGITAFAYKAVFRREAPLEPQQKQIKNEEFPLTNQRNNV